MKRNVMTPLLWFDGVVMGSCVAILTKSPASPDLRVFAMCLMGAAFLLTSAVYVYFAIRDPNLLQSESHQFRHRMLSILQQQGGPITVEPTSLNVLFLGEPKE